MYDFFAKYLSMASVGIIFLGAIGKVDPWIAIPSGLGIFAVACLLKLISLKKKKSPR